MTKHAQVFGILLCISVLELAGLAAFAMHRSDFSQDMVVVNEIAQTVACDWGNMETHTNRTDADYVVLDDAGNVIYRTKRGLSESMHEAVAHRDTILPVETAVFKDAVPAFENARAAAGSILIYNDTAKQFQKQKQLQTGMFAAAILLQCMVCGGYLCYLSQRLVRPFGKLRGFAERIAQGNLDIPLEMDRHNLFGAFTESFDIMRAELKKARIAEAEANAGKKELVARLSHDIKTPVASIKAASEVGCAIAENEKLRENYMQIIQKADQINMLITNLFTATLEELKHLPVVPVDMESRELPQLLGNADYLHRAGSVPVPECLLLADPLRLQQVFDNIFANSYKYADTKIDVSIKCEHDMLLVCIEDYGGGVGREELPLLKEKYKRGSNAGGTEGAGLGLFISEHFMKEMHGGLLLENGTHGLKVIVKIALSGGNQER